MSQYDNRPLVFKTQSWDIYAEKPSLYLN